MYGYTPLFCVGLFFDSHTGKSLTEYASGLIDIGIFHIPSEAAPGDNPPFHGTVQDHMHLMGACRETMQVLAEKEDVQAMAAPVLLYPAIHKRSIYVSPDDPYIVTGMVSWRSACIGPAFVHVVFTPDFADKKSPR